MVISLTGVETISDQLETEGNVTLVTMQIFVVARAANILLQASQVSMNHLLYETVHEMWHFDKCRLRRACAASF